MAKNTEHEDLVVEDAGAGPRVYELGFHLDGDLPTEEAKKTYADIRGSIAAKGTIVAEGEPAKIQLAYTISRSEQAGRRDFNTAYFCWIAYEAAPEAHADMVKMAGSEARIIRFIDILTTKEQAQHSQELAEVYAKSVSEEGAGTEEEVMDTEIDAALKEMEEVA